MSNAGVNSGWSTDRARIEYERLGGRGCEASLIELLPRGFYPGLLSWKFCQEVSVTEFVFIEFFVKGFCHGIMPGGSSDMEL